MHRILFLGSGGDIQVIGKQIRSSGGLILNIENEQFHIDPGPSSLLMARMHSINVRETTALFITSNDLIKANDANAVISAMTHEGLDKKSVLVCPSSLIEKKEDNKEPFIHKFYINCVEKVIITDNTKKLAINNIDVEVIDLKESIGLKFITHKYILSYLPDTDYNNDLAEKLKNTDILILSVQDPRNIKRKEHLNSEDAEKIISKVKPQLTIITGFGIKMIQADPLYEAREIQKNTGINVVSAKDGMLINPLSFTTTVKQSSLKNY
ncbi:MAG: hypothetical protein QXE31_06480 [Candidatus Woesearchaeota archaeon]